MVVVGWIILGLFGAAYLFGVPLLISGGYQYGRTLLAWLGFLVVATVLILLLIFAVGAVTGVIG